MESPSEAARVSLPSSASKDVVFGPFRLAAAERRLDLNGCPVQIGSRALDILVALVASAGEVIDKRTLLAKVWPGIVVEESSLRAHIAGLRKALGDGVGDARYIANVPGRGYCFVGLIASADAAVPAEVSGHEHMEAPPASESRAFTQLPPSLGRMIGRDATVAALLERLNKQRFLSLVGPGGIGKTTLAISLANQRLRQAETRAAFVDLSFVDDAGLVLATLAGALGLRLDGTDFTLSILAALKEKPTLLVLDSCEHVIDIVAGMCERIFIESPSSTIIVTSREALRVEGESVFRLPPLAVPPEEVPSGVADTASYAAVQMFVERAQAAGLDVPDDSEMLVVARLCRQLDGLPLAIELAAARASSFGISGLAKLLDQQFGLYWQGRRTAHPRHQTMHSVLDWSYRLLTDYERQVLQRLSVFKGLFTFSDALSVVLESGSREGDLIDALDALLAKSLISSSVEQQLQYRLLESTRAYAAYRLDESANVTEAKKRHALWVCSQLERQILPSLIGFHSSRHNVFTAQLGDIRSALEWAFSDSGEAGIASRLSAMASHAFLSMSLLEECGHWARAGLGCLDGAEKDNVKLELSLLASLAVSMMFTSAGSHEIKKLILRGLGLAVEVNDVNHELWLLSGLHLLEVRLGNVDGVFAVAQRAQAVGSASGDDTVHMLSAWMLGMSHHLAGRQDKALRYCHPQAYWKDAHHPIVLFGFDQRIRALIVRTRALWLAGYADQACRLAWFAIEQGAQSTSPVSHCLALIYSSTLFFWTGKLDAADETVNKLLDISAHHGLSHYSKVAACLQGELWVRQGRVEPGIGRLEEYLRELRSEQHEVLVWGFNLALAQGYAHAGRLDDANCLLDGAIASAGNERFDLPELLRVKAEISVQEDPGTIDKAHALLWKAIDIATKQNASAWVLRCVTSLAELSYGHEVDPRIRHTLSMTLADLREGRADADYLRASAVFSRLHEHSLTADA